MKEGPTLLIAGSAACEKAAVAKWPGANIVGSFRDLTLVEFILSSMPVDVVAVESGLPTRGESFQDWTARFKSAFPKVSLVSWIRVGIPAEAETNPPTSAASPSSAHAADHRRMESQGWSREDVPSLPISLRCRAIDRKERPDSWTSISNSGDVAVHLDLVDGPTVTGARSRTGQIPGLRV